jgi:kinesin family protein 6/9
MTASDEEQNSVSDSSTIQIYCRVRPIKPNNRIEQGRYWTRNPEVVDEKDPDAIPKIGFYIPRDLSAGMINNSRENFEFKFNRVFDMDARQEEVFDVVAKPVVTSVLNGYNGTIFAYGQTGSGKVRIYFCSSYLPRKLNYMIG